jgi:predicted lysophospholipase L1 biosynthesis ABC-type transport system permease subunit
VEICPGRLFPEIRPLKQLYHEIAKQIEQIAAVVSLIGLIAVLRAAVGIIGLVGFSVSQRTKQIAIRLALGSPKARLCGLLLKQFAWRVMGGLAAGGLLAMMGSKFRVALFSISNLDPAGFFPESMFFLAWRFYPAPFPPGARCTLTWQGTPL